VAVLIKATDEKSLLGSVSLISSPSTLSFRIFFRKGFISLRVGSAGLQGLDTLLIKQTYAAVVSLFIHFAKIDAEPSFVKYKID
jgi:hypothetical protein